jgi:origin recognition complex subunit 3
MKPIKTFFDPTFEPEIMMGPTAIDFAVEFFTRHSSSFDGLLSIFQVCYLVLPAIIRNQHDHLQLAHMKHFEEPLSVLALAQPLGRPEDAAKLLLTPDAFPFLDALFARVQDSALIVPAEHATRWRTATVDSLLSSVDTARNTFRMHAKLLRVAFRLVLRVRQFMLAQGYKTAQGEQTVPELMCMALRGRLSNVYGYLCSLVRCVGFDYTVLTESVNWAVAAPCRKLPEGTLDDFVRVVHDFFKDVPEDVRVEEDEVISRVNTAYKMLGRDMSAQSISDPLRNWLSEYFKYVPLLSPRLLI